MSSMTIGEVVVSYFKRTRLRQSNQVDQPPADYGLFYSNGEGKSLWLNNDKTLLEYDIPSGSTVYIKAKLNSCRITLRDSTVLTVIVDTSFTSVYNSPKNWREIRIVSF
eukprot:TRINITY_DN15853_c0_g1_i1.p1 TRINITY_DN15853_c0_g1~~TRINITY_DN15853_c0_g1_i1.p1  ORF type:complete len:109 (+),score=24.11 TRINITY_DN15853_c0_g1_i1:27-353(+)